MPEKKIKQLNSQQKEDVLLKLMNAYLSPAFGALPKNEVELVMLEALVEIGHIEEEPEVYDLVSKLKITRSKARNLIYERELRRSSSDDLDEKVKEILRKPILQKDGKNLILEVENPLVSDHLKNKVKNLGYLSDGSFSPSIVKLSFVAIGALIEEDLSKEDIKKVKEILMKAGATDASFKGMVKAMFTKIASKVADETGEAVAENISECINPIIDSSFATLKVAVKDLYKEEEQGD